jgi:uncharacterized membrane protein YeaQ/YmgE (transglycosylase-associated protein family)
MIYSWIIITGLLTGALARFLTMRGERAVGFVISGCLGISGALLTAWIWQLTSLHEISQNAIIVGAASGAMILLSGYRTLTLKIIS